MNHAIVILAITGAWFLVAYNVDPTLGIMVTDCTTPGQRIADSDNTSLYYLCAVQFPNGSWYTVEMSCPSGAYFNTTFNDCLVVDDSPTTSLPSITPIFESSTSTSTEATSSVGTSTATTSTATTSSKTTPSTTTPSTTTPATTTPSTTTPSTTTPSTTTSITTTSSTTTNTPPGCTTRTPMQCPSEGRYPDDTDCSKYYICLNYVGTWYRFEYFCQVNQYYNPVTQNCALGPCPFTMNPCPTATTTMMTTTTTTQLPTTTTTGAGYICQGAGYFPDPSGSCTKYYQCLTISGIWYYYIYDCPSGTYYDVTTQRCKSGTCPSNSTA